MAGDRTCSKVCWNGDLLVIVVVVYLFFYDPLLRNHNTIMTGPDHKKRKFP